jgi:AraC family transcriptional regulator
MTVDSSLSVKQREAMAVAYVSRKGPYDQIPEAMGALFGGLAQKGLVPAGPPGGRYFSVPGDVSEAESLWEVWVPLAGDPAEAPAEGIGLGVRRVAAAEVACAMHRGPYDTIDQTYAVLVRWVAENGYEAAGPPEEVYFSGPETPPDQILTEVRLPVKKA